MAVIRKDPFLTKSGWVPLFFSGLVVTVALLSLFALHPRFITHLEYRLYDAFLTARPAVQTTGLPVIVDIDEPSLARYGQWPWPRYRLANLLNALFRSGAAVVSFDMVFAEPDRTSLARLVEEMQRDLEVTVRFSEIPAAALDNDRFFADSLKQGTAVLGFGLIFGDASRNAGCPGSILKIPVLQKPEAPEGRPAVFRAQGAACNIPVLAQAASAQGFLNVRPDSDGVLRRALLLAEHAGELYPSLALATYLAAGKVKTAMVQVASEGVQSLLLDGRPIPLDEQGNLWIRFRGPSGSFPCISASQVLDGTVAADALRKRVVFIGSTAGGLKDIHATPYDPVFAGVEVHAHIFDNLAAGDSIRRPRWMAGIEALLLIGFGTASTLLFIRLGPLFSAGFVLAGSMFLGAGTFGCLEFLGTYFSPFYSALALFGNFALLNLMKYYQEEKKVRAKTRELSLVQAVTIETVANVAETRDPETGGHIKRTQHYVRALAEHLRQHPKYRKILNDDIVEILFRSAPLHDLGKVGVPDHILLKPDRLTEDEFNRMKLHTTYAYNIISAAEQRLGNSSFLRTARELAHTHQEKWDGSGYPQGLKGEDIPLAGRLMAIADVYDALISRRPYKPSMPHETAVQHIRQGRGSHFDPELVDAFLEIEGQFREISRQFTDTNTSEGHPA